MKNYPPEFKADAVALYQSRPGATIRQIAADLGINPETLRNWVRAAGASLPRGRRAEAPTEPPAPLEAELAAARKRIRELEEEREILRKAAKYFARRGDALVGAVICFRSQPRSVSLISFPRSGSSLDFTLTSTPSVSPTCRAVTGPCSLAHDGEDALVVRREHVLLCFGAAVRDEHHGPPGHLAGRRGGRGRLACDLFAYSLEDSFGDGEFVPFGSHLGQLLGQLFFEVVQFRASRGDPF